MESLSRISNLLETARELTIEAAQSASAVRGLRGGYGARPLPASQIKKLLDSRNERDILDGLRRVISMMYRGQDCLPLFSSVIKNVAAPSLEIRKLVYVYLLHHAEAEPDLALLSINAIQKSLADANAPVRALALRVMSGIRVPVISQIVSLAIKKGCQDMSAAVRRAAALAIPKCVRLDAGTRAQLLEPLAQLLGDRQYLVAGAAVVAFMDVCPERIDLVHRHYRALVRKLVDMDEWSQLATLRLLTNYARRCFPRPTPKRAKRGGEAPESKSHSGAETDADANADADADADEPLLLDPDLELLLTACRALLHSRNAAVIVAVARCFACVGTPAHLDAAAGPLVSLLRSDAAGAGAASTASAAVHEAALYNIACVCARRPRAFAPYAARFLVRAADAPRVQRLKLELLALVFAHCDARRKGVILCELEHFARASHARDLVRASVRAIGRCAQADAARLGAVSSSASASASYAARCLRLLLRLVTSPDGALAAEALTVVRHLIQHDLARHANTVILLAQQLPSIADAQARATIIWLVGELAGLSDGRDGGDGEVGGRDGGRDSNNAGHRYKDIAVAVLQYLVRGFADEAEPAKLQIILFAAKTYVHYLNHVQDEQENRQEEEEAAAGYSYSYNDNNSGKNNNNTFSSGDGDDPNSHFSMNPFQDNATTVPSVDVHDAKTAPLKEHLIAVLWRYVLLLARYDTSYDLRDRARFYKALLASADAASTQLATLLLLAPKPVPHTPSPSESRKDFVLGSASLIVGRGGGGGGGGGGGSSGSDMGGIGVGTASAAAAAAAAGVPPTLMVSGALPGYEAVPDWVEAGKEPDPRLRDDPSSASYAAPPGTAIVPPGKFVVSSSSSAAAAAARAVSAADRLDQALRMSGDRAGARAAYANERGSGMAAGRGTEGRSSGRKEKTLDDWLAEDDVQRGVGGVSTAGQKSLPANEEESDDGEEDEEDDEEDDDEEEGSEEEENDASDEDDETDEDDGDDDGENNGSGNNNGPR